MQVGERGLGGLAVRSQLGDALGDELRFDTGFEGLDLGLHPAVEVGDLVAEALGGALALRSAPAPFGRELLLQAVQTQRSEDSLREEALHEIEHMVLAQVDPLGATVDLGGGGLAVVGPV
ncbi:hypothetical protein [Patulibacter defluvii]|uniref:hypothetical protein n=1 Tax=Patulibacter defluvii TaxID=3095358 RepID=UPI002A762BD2|nr:hypothetical protein [Patulibacter sp. DM4]